GHTLLEPGEVEAAVELRFHDPRAKLAREALLHQVVEPLADRLHDTIMQPLLNAIVNDVPKPGADPLDVHAARRRSEFAHLRRTSALRRAHGGLDCVAESLNV